jgi:hypothetical protein
MSGEELNDRLERLEKLAEENHRLSLENAELHARSRRQRRSALGLALLVLAGGVALARGTATAQDGLKIIHANGYILKDSAGNERGSFGLLEGEAGVVLSLNDKKGRERARLSCQDDGMRALTFFDQEGAVRLSIVNQANPNVTGVTIFDKEGKHRGWLTYEKEGSSLGLANKNGDVVFSKP